MTQKRQPERMCVGCGTRRPKAELIRVVCNKEGAVFLDPTGKADGRGAYLVETRDSDDTNAASIYFERGKTSSASGTSWRCGLMDENGKIIVPVTHTSVEVTDDLRVIFDGAADATAVAID